MQTTLDTPAPVTKPSPRSIACMEVWGGSQAFDLSVSVPGNDVRVSCTPYGGDVSGGDIYYISNCAAGIITRFFLADVSGHGEQVAHIANDLRSLMRRHINTANPTRFAIALNKAFAGLELDGRFATAVLMTYFAPTDHLIVCNAGHPRPLLFRASARSWGLLDVHTPGVLITRQSGRSAVGIANLPLGILDPTDYQQFAVGLEPGDLVIAYTDALMEATDAGGRLLGDDGLLGLARSLSVQDLEDVAAALRSRVLEYSAQPALNDDATLIALHHNAADPPPLSWGGQAAKFARMLGLGAVDSGPGIPE